MHSYAQVRLKIPLWGIVARFLLVALLTFGVYNPSSFTITAWLVTSDANTAVRTLIAISIVIIWLVVLRVSLAGLGRFGAFLVACLLVIFGIVELNMRLLSSMSPFVLIVLGQLFFCAVITFGLVLSYFIRQLTGQSQVVKIPP